MGSERFRRQFKVTGNYVGPDDCAHAWFVQNVAQDVSIAVTEHHGFDTRWYRARGTGWVMRRFQAELVRPWILDDQIVVETWISKRKRVSVHRDYLFLDGAGAPLGGAQAEWVYLEASTGRPAPLSPEIEERLAVEPEEAISPWPEQGGEWAFADPGLRITRAVGYSDLDGYGHANNTVYLRWIADLLHQGGPGEFWMRRWRIEYRKAARLGQEVSLEAASCPLSSGGALWQVSIRDLLSSEELVRSWVVTWPRSAQDD
ncbi:MAG: thioesterase [candidate division KSB1 bacterium]|nr:thioesterase [candidate division KSB1 bacterium]